MPFVSPLPKTEPPRDCPHCPRLVALRERLRAEHTDWWNAPVPAFGDPGAWLVIVGLAPGKQGANRTGRPFTGDSAGDLLFETLAKFGLTKGAYRGDADDSLALDGAIICNAVKCLPPANKPSLTEQASCRPFLEAQIAALTGAHVYVALGETAHKNMLRAFDLKLSAHKFAHGAEHRLTDGIIMIDSYHCSRYNQNTGRLTATMFEPVFARALEMR